MELVIDVDGAAPVFVQLIEQIKKAVLRNTIRPGDALPSIRQLANDLGVNINAVAEAYRLLERDCVILTKGLHSLVVHPWARSVSGPGRWEHRSWK